MRKVRAHRHCFGLLLPLRQKKRWCVFCFYPIQIARKGHAETQRELDASFFMSECLPPQAERQEPSHRPNLLHCPCVLMVLCAEHFCHMSTKVGLEMQLARFYILEGDQQELLCWDSKYNPGVNASFYRSWYLKGKCLKCYLLLYKLLWLVSKRQKEAHPLLQNKVHRYSLHSFASLLLCEIDMHVVLVAFIHAFICFTEVLCYHHIIHWCQWKDQNQQCVCLLFSMFWLPHSVCSKQVYTNKLIVIIIFV